MIIFSKTWNLGWKKKIQNFQKHKIDKIRELPNTGPYSRYKALEIFPKCISKIKLRKF
jgi:hypothetical protein